MKVMFVCAGNLFRSVIAECVFKARAEEILGKSAGVLVAESSGLEAETAAPPHPACLMALESLGLPAAADPPTLTDESHIREADLVITMTRQQSYILAHRFRESSGKIFSLREINGALETVLETQEGSSRADVDAAGSLEPPALDRALREACIHLSGIPRETMRPLAGVPLNVFELMTLFAPCFHQVSGVHDPLGGTDEEILECARDIEREVGMFLRNLLALGLSMGDGAAGRGCG